MAFSLHSISTLHPSKSFRHCSFAYLRRPHALSHSRSFNVFCTAKPETVEKVVEIVTKQLVARQGLVQPDSKFADLGADSLDQVEIAMALEEEFDIELDESGAEGIVTVEDVAALIEKVKS